MRKIFVGIILISIVFTFCACSVLSQSEDDEESSVPSGSSLEDSISSSIESSQSENEPSAHLFPSSESEKDDVFFEDSPPDEGTDIIDNYDEGSIRDQVEAMVDYLEKNLDPWDYTEIMSAWGVDGGHIDISTPFPDAVKSVVANYTGKAVAVEYHYEEFSKAQLEQAEKDLNNFVEEHPEIEILQWKPILLFGGYKIFLKEENKQVTDFIKAYPVANIYQVTISPNGIPETPD